MELDVLARSVVRLRLRATPDGNHPSFKEVAARALCEGLDVRDERDAHDLYTRALADGLVGIEVLDGRRKAASSAENAPLGRQLTDAVRQALGSRTSWFEAHVVEASYPAGDLAAEDDSVHEQLGWHAGCVWLSREVASGDRIGVAAGRAAVWTISGLLETRGLDGLALYALSGASERGIGAVAGRSLDADSVVRHAVASCVRTEHTPEKVRYTTLPLALPEETLGRGSPNGLLHQAAHHLLDDWWAERRPEVAVLGFASVGRDPRHPLALTQNALVLEKVGELKRLTETYGDDGLVIGEVAHHLWVACDPGTPGADAAARLVNELNRLLVAPTPAALGRS
jgi:hypothetical protein